MNKHEVMILHPDEGKSQSKLGSAPVPMAKGKISPYHYPNTRPNITHRTSPRLCLCQEMVSFHARVYVYKPVETEIRGQNGRFQKRDGTGTCEMCGNAVPALTESLMRDPLRSHFCSRETFRYGG